MTNEAFYDDGRVACDEAGLKLRWYYPRGAKRIRYASIKAVQRLPLTGVNKVRAWRLWGSGDFVHWWNLDQGRIHKDVAFVLDVGGRIRPTFTPDDPDAVERILPQHVAT